MISPNNAAPITNRGSGNFFLNCQSKAKLTSAIAMVGKSTSDRLPNTITAPAIDTSLNGFPYKALMCPILLLNSDRRAYR